MINAVVIDDEPIALEGITDYMRRVDFITCIGSFQSPLEAAALLRQNLVGLLFLDIEMPTVRGLDFLSSLDNPPPTIFITAYADFAHQAYDLDVLDYLLKPVSFERFYKACCKALDYCRLKSPESAVEEPYFFIKSEYRYEKICLKDIIYIEGRQNYICIHTQSRKYMTHMTMKSVSNVLPSGDFLRVHRSFIVSVRHVDRIDRNSLLVNGSHIPVSREHKEAIHKRILEGKLFRDYLPGL